MMSNLAFNIIIFLFKKHTTHTTKYMFESKAKEK
jgi:hypothetical protein